VSKKKDSILLSVYQLFSLISYICLEMRKTTLWEQSLKYWTVNTKLFISPRKMCFRNYKSIEFLLIFKININGHSHWKVLLLALKSS